MSDTIPIPYEPGTPEYDQYVRGMMRAPLPFSSLAPGALAQLLPAGKTEQGDYRATLPGMLTAAYGGAGTFIPEAINYVGRKLGYNVNIPPAPGAENAQQQYDDTSRLAKVILPTEKLAESPEEQRMHDALFSAGGMITPIPAASVAKAASMLPTGLQTVGKVLGHLTIPTKEAAPVTAPVMGLLTGEASDYLDPSKGVPDTVEGYNNTLKDVQGAGGTATLPFSSTSAETPSPSQPIPGQPPADQSLDIFGVPTTQVQPPTYSGEGQSGTAYGAALGYGLAGLGAAWLVMKHGGKVLNPIADAYRGIDNDVAAFNAHLDQIDRVGGAPPVTDPAAMPNRGEAPLPGGAGSFTTSLAQKLWDPNRVVDAYTAGISGGPTTTAAQEFAATTGMVENANSLSNRIAAQMRTGVDQATGHSMQSLYDIVTDIDKLNPGQRQVLDYGLMARDELDTRMIKLNQARNTPGAPIDDPSLRFNLYNEDSSTLRAARDLMMNDPVTASIANDIKTMQLQHIDNMELRGRITSEVADQLRRERPNYISSVDQNGKISRAFGERDVATFGGFGDMPTSPIDAIVQHYDALYKDMAHNEWTRNIVLNGVQAQDRDPTLARVFTEKIGPDGKPAPLGDSERGVTIQTSDGPRYFHVDNTALWNSLSRNNARSGLLMNGTAALKNAYVRGTTGVSGTILAQQLFAVKNLIRNAMQIGIDRTPGTYGGLLDRVLQRQGLPGYRGFDPTTIPASFLEGGRGAAAVMAKNIGDMLMIQDHPISQMFRASKGDAWTDALAQRMHQRFEGSMAAERHNLGATGGGSYGLSTPPAYQMTKTFTGIPDTNVINPLADASPTLFREQAVNNIKIPFTNVRLPGARGTVATYINLRSMLRDVHNEVSDGANAYYYRLNRDNPNLSRNRLAFESRRVIGDPSVAGTALQGAGKVIPYLNPTIQDALRMARNFRDNPFSTTFGVVNTLGTVALASTLTAMLGGKSHVDHLENQVGTQQRAANGIFYHDMTNPLNHTEISLPQRWRPLYPIILEMVATGLGAFDAHKDEGLYERTIHAAADFFSHHIQTSTETSAVHGVGDMFDVTVPPAIGTPAALAGYTVQSPVSTILNNKYSGQQWNQDLIREYDKPGRAPGTVRGDTLVSHDDGKFFQNVLSAIYGAAGSGYATYFDAPAKRMAEGASLFDAIKGIGSDVSQGFRDKAPYGNFIWGNNVKATTFNPMEESVHMALNNMKNLKAPNDISSTGFASTSSAQPVVTRGQPNTPTDPTMLNMYMFAHNTYVSLKPLLSATSDTTTQINNINSSGYSAEIKRKLIDNLASKANDQWALIDARIKSMNGALSQMAGGKHVDIRGKINWGGTVSQFHD